MQWCPGEKDDEPTAAAVGADPLLLVLSKIDASVGGSPDSETNRCHLAVDEQQGSSWKKISSE